MSFGPIFFLLTLWCTRLIPMHERVEEEGCRLVGRPTQMTKSWPHSPSPPIIHSPFTLPLTLSLTLALSTHLLFILILFALLGCSSCVLHSSSWVHPSSSLFILFPFSKKPKNILSFLICILLHLNKNPKNISLVLVLPFHLKKTQKYFLWSFFRTLSLSRLWQVHNLSRTLLLLPPCSCYPHNPRATKH